MNRLILSVTALLFSTCTIFGQGQYTVRYLISGKVTDFSGNPIDSAVVELKKHDFTAAAIAITDSEGKYRMTVDEGKYIAMTCTRPSEYPSGSALNPEDQRLRFWGWNIPVTGNVEIDIRYHRLEIYGVNIFRIPGAAPGYVIYCRPISLTRIQKSDDESTISPGPEDLDVLVEINGRPVKVNSIQRIEEYTGKNSFLYAYIVQVAAPAMTGKNYDFFRIIMKDKQNGDTGESIYFKDKEGYW
jgi:hypothetical protein